MSFQKIVCPYNTTLLDRLHGRVIAARVYEPCFIPETAEYVGKSGNELFCVILDSDKAVETIELKDEIRGIPIALFAPSAGKFRNLVKRLEHLRSLNLRVYLPYSQENLTGIRILASVGVHCCIILEDGEIDWESVTDLMTYAVLERVPHASIEPFVYIAEHYNQTSYTKWGLVYFDDPVRFLHLDSKGRVALTHRELMAGNFIATDISDLENAAEHPTIEKRAQSWRYLFINNHFCSGCAGFRICMGRFASGRERPSGCPKFFSEMMEIVEQYRSRLETTRKARIWQP